MGYVYDEESGGFISWPDGEDKPVDPVVLGDSWTDLGFTDDIEGTIFSAPSIDSESDWFKRDDTGRTSQPGVITLNLEGTDVSQDALTLLFGGTPGEPMPTRHAVLIDTTDTVSGRPPYPELPSLDLPWWRIRERRRRVALRGVLIDNRDREYADWVAAGRPDREIHIRRYIPSARIVHGD